MRNRFYIIICTFILFYGCSHQVKENYPSGKLKAEGEKIDGKMEGQWKFYFENGNLSGIGSYSNGDGGDVGITGIPNNGRVGEWVLYYENGKMQSKRQYENGKEISGLYYSGAGEELGNKLKYQSGLNKFTIFYTRNITKDILDKFCKNFLDTYFAKRQDSVGTLVMAIDKYDSYTYKFLIPAKTGIENDLETKYAMKNTSKYLKDNVFEGKRVDMYLCDDDFITKKVITGD